MKHGSLFSGIGGFDLASEWMGWENVFQVEIDDYCQKVLAKNFPNVKRYGDIKEFKGECGSVDILTGGFPCQPFSHAGKRKGESDDRYLWPEYLRIIREIQPTYVVGENVAGLVSMEDGKTLNGIFTDLEGEGYTVESFIIPACGVGAWHRRDRIWIIGYLPERINGNSSRTNTNSIGPYRPKEQQQGEAELRDKQECGAEGLGEDVSNPKPKRLQRKPKRQMGESSKPTQNGWWESEPNVGRVANGIPRRVDRLKGLGNAIVPQVAYEIFEAIEQLNNKQHETS